MAASYSAILDDPIMLDPVTGLRRKILIFTEPKTRSNTCNTRSRAASAIRRRRRHPWRHRTRGTPRRHRRLQQRPGRARDDRQRRRRRRREPSARRPPDGQLRPPWNPNRLEQRFGRIHRIGQTEVCHLWNLCADQHARGRGLPAPSGKAGGGARGARRQGLRRARRAVRGAGAARP